MTWHVLARRWFYPTHAWVGRLRWGRYVLIQWWPTEASRPGIGLVWGRRSFAIGLHKRSRVAA